MPPVEDNAVYYSNSARTTWPRCPLIEIAIHTSPPILIPIDFVIRSGNNTWGLVCHLAQLMVNEPGELRRLDGVPVVLVHEPQAIECRFVRVDGLEFTWAKGPQSAVRGKVAIDDTLDVPSQSSSRSSTRQSTLRHDVLVRDGNQCIVSDSGGATLCEAAHIVPKSRPDIYQEILGRDYANELFHVTMAITIKADLHRAYDAYKWSFYCKDGIMFVHVFSADSYLIGFHGHAITEDRFRWRTGGDYLPDVRLCDWHYKQCVLMYLRRFSAGMGVNAY